MTAPTNGQKRPTYDRKPDRMRSAAASSAAASSADEQARQSPHPLEPLMQQAAMVREFALHYVEAQKDATKAAVRRLVMKAVVALIAALVGGTILITAAVMIADGLAELVSVAAGGQAWVGKLVVGGGTLVILALAAWFFIARMTRAERQRVLRKYESRHHAQRAKFGTDVSQRAES